MGYHTSKIKKGELGRASKIQEELDELLDAELQSCKILALCELSDLVGAVQAYLEHNYPNITLDDLIQMSNLTRKAFKEGERK